MDLIKVVKLCESSDPGDARIVMEFLKKEFYPNMPEELVGLLYTGVRSDILHEYCNTPDNWVGLEDWDISWKTDDNG